MFHVKHLGAALLAALLFAGCTGNTTPQAWAPPLPVDDLLIVSNRDGSVSALRVAGADQPTVAWTYPPPDENGEPWWRRLFSSGSQGEHLEALYATPVTEQVGQQRRVYLAGYSGHVIALDLATGRRVDGWPDPVDVGGRIVATPAFDDGRLLVANQDGAVLAVDATSGALGSPLLQAGDRIWTAPRLQGDTLIVSSFDRFVRAIDPSNGELRWEQDLGGAIAGEPAFAGSTMIAPTLASRLVAIDTAASGTRLWEFPGDNWFWSQPLVAGEVVYAVTTTGTVYAIDLSTGRERWRYEGIDSVVHAAPALVGGSLVVATRDGAIVGIDPNGGTENWRTQQDARFYSDPVVRGSNILYAAENGSLYRVTPAEQGRTELMFQPED
jgi:outer membrane protein assembly factor BamB